MENETLAIELLHQLKRNAILWFTIAMAELFIIVGTVCAFLWYISLPVDECTVEQTIDEVDASDITQVGGDYNGESNTEGN